MYQYQLPFTNLPIINLPTRSDNHAKRKTQHPHHLGRRHRHHQPELLQRWADGLPHPQHRPHRQRRDALHRFVRPAELHRRPRRLHHRAEPLPHRPDQGGHARRRHRPAGGGRHHCRAAQAAGLRHRPVRQEPLRRQEQVPAHRPRLRRVLRQPVSPERRGRAGECGLSAGSGLPQFQEDLWPPRRHALLGHRRRRSHRAAALGPRRQAEDRGHRPADQEAHGDLRHRVRGRRPGLHQARPRRRPALLRLAQHHLDALPRPPAEADPRPGRALAVLLPRRDGGARQARGPDAGPAGRAGHRRRHHRHVLAPTTART